MKIRLIPEATFHDNAFAKPGITFKIKAGPATLKALQKLHLGCSEKDLLEGIVDEDPITFYYILENLSTYGFLFYETPFLEMFPHREYHLRKFEDLPYTLSRFTLCHLPQEKLCLENPLGFAKAYLSEIGVKLLHCLSKCITLKELSSKFGEVNLNEIQETLQLLLAGEMIVSATEESSSLAQWEFHDLFFHTRSRIGRVEKPYGGTFRFRGIYPSQPSVRKCEETSYISLPQNESAIHASLGETLTKRKSIREHGNKPITAKQLGEFLWHSARVITLKVIGDEEFASRPYPGGGGRYPLEIYPIVYQCEGIEKGVYYYNPLEHRLIRISPLNHFAEELLKDACNCSGKKEYPQILFSISARFQRVSWKYESIAYALILKELGVLYQTMYLVATALDLAPCALGGGNSDLFCKVTGRNYLEETSVGEFMLGSLP